MKQRRYTDEEKRKLVKKIKEIIEIWDYTVILVVAGISKTSYDKWRQNV